ncbi:hypothetical protein KKF04_04020 [Patescibacteria group bacterium]|nr:hypothetical protein [Patescibacteria group bacterium]
MKTEKEKRRILGLIISICAIFASLVYSLLTEYPYKKIAIFAMIYFLFHDIFKIILFGIWEGKEPKKPKLWGKIMLKVVEFDNYLFGITLFIILPLFIVFLV